MGSVTTSNDTIRLKTLIESHLFNINSSSNILTVKPINTNLSTRAGC